MKNILVEKFGKEKRWVNWKLIEREGKQTKIPYYSGSNKASSTDQKTWRTYEEVSVALDNGSNGFRGLGIVLHDSKLLCIDIDHVLKDGKIYHPQAKKIFDLLKHANSFTEISQSGTGLHIFLELHEPYTLIANKKAPFEVYLNGRFIATTGNSYHEVPLGLRTVSEEELLSILSTIGYPWGKNGPINGGLAQTEHIDDQVLLKKIFGSKNGADFKKLYEGGVSKYDNDFSSADFALCSTLAFWTAKNSAQMERIWLSSPLGQRGKTRERNDYRIRTIANAIEKCVEVYEPYKQEPSANKNLSQADLLIKMILDRKDVLLFKDERDAPFIALDINGHMEIWKCNSQTIKDLLSFEFYRANQKTVSSEVVKSAVSVLEGKAKFTGGRIKLNNRTSLVDNVLWYDLTNKEWQAVKVTSNQWEVVNNPPALFKRYSHQSSQVIPMRSGKAELILNYVNITNESHRLLLLVFVISCFVPDFPHPALVIFGSQGSAKSTLSKLLRRIIDPSLMEVVNLPKEQKELIQKLDHHYFSFFDNVSFIPEETSDTLCKAITGSGFSKRILYTDDDDIIYNFMRCIGINGINVVATRPDLLERSILVELNRIEEEERKQEKDLYENFNKDLPIILGGIFDVLVKTLEIKPKLRLNKLPRMADFMVWGCAITEGLGYKKEDFIKAYETNIKEQTQVALHENSVALAIILFMKEKSEWIGTASELLDKLNLEDTFGDVYNKGPFPRAPNTLARRLNELKVNLKSIGILYESKSNGDTRVITLKKVIKTDSTDDISEGSLL